VLKVDTMTEAGAETGEHRADRTRADAGAGDRQPSPVEPANGRRAAPKRWSHPCEQIGDGIGTRPGRLADHVEPRAADALAQHGDQVLFGDRHVEQRHDGAVGSDLNGIAGIYLQDHAEMMPDRAFTPCELCTG
jgi:hypothetical protein